MVPSWASRDVRSAAPCTRRDSCEAGAAYHVIGCTTANSSAVRFGREVVVEAVQLVVYEGRDDDEEEAMEDGAGFEVIRGWSTDMGTDPPGMAILTV